MNLYHYDATTKIYKRTTTPATSMGVPANATSVAVPTIPAGQEAVYNESTTSWSVRPISVPTPSAAAPLTEFANMTLAQKLAHYGLGDLTSHIAGSASVAQKAVVDVQISAIKTLLTKLQNDVIAMGTTNATVTANQQLIRELVEDFNRMNSTLLLEENH